MGSRVWQRAAACESCTLRERRTYFPSEESLPLGFLQYPAGLVLHENLSSYSNFKTFSLCLLLLQSKSKSWYHRFVSSMFA